MTASHALFTNDGSIFKPAQQKFEILHVTSTDGICFMATYDKAVWVGVSRRDVLNTCDLLTNLANFARDLKIFGAILHKLNQLKNCRVQHEIME